MHQGDVGWILRGHTAAGATKVELIISSEELQALPYIEIVAPGEGIGGHASFADFVMSHHVVLDMLASLPPAERRSIYGQMKQAWLANDSMEGQP